jgi:uncharacterized protein YwgA
MPSPEDFDLEGEGDINRRIAIAMYGWYSQRLTEEVEKLLVLTLPCVECGESVDADIHAEELGFCLDCSNAYFDHSDEEETEKENN